MITRILTILGIIIALGGAYVAIDDRYAHSFEMKNLEMRLDQKIISDRSDQLQERIWNYQDRSANNKKPDPNLENELRSLKAEKQKLDDQLKIINENAIKLNSK